MFKKLFSNMDLFKAVIMGSVLVVLGLAVWGWRLYGSLKKGEAAMAAAKGDDLASVATIEAQIQQLRDDQRKVGGRIDDTDPGVYFYSVITDYGKVPRDVYKPTFTAPSREVAGIKDAQDRETTIDWSPATGGSSGAKRYWLSRNTIWTIIYNAEALSPRWKLRQLHIRPREDVEKGGSGGSRSASYPETLSDEWAVEKMVFASRTPKPKEPAKEPKG